MSYWDEEETIQDPPLEIIRTNNPESLKRNRFALRPDGTPDESQPFGEFYILMSKEEASQKGVRILGSEEPERDNLTRPSPSAQALKHSAAKEISAKISLLPSESQNAHGLCGGMGLVDGQICLDCEGRGHIILDSTIDGGYADLNSAACAHNQAVLNHNLFCTPDLCHSRCWFKQQLDELRRRLNISFQRPHPFRMKLGAFHYSGNLEELNQLTFMVVEDKWTPTAPGLRAFSTRNNVEGSRTTKIRPGDLVHLHLDFTNPYITMLVANVSESGALSGFAHIPTPGRSHPMNQGDEWFGDRIAYALIEDSFNPVSYSQKEELKKIQILYGELRSMFTGTEETILEFDHPKLTWVSNISSDVASKLDPIIEPHLQFRGYWIDQIPFGDLRDRSNEKWVDSFGNPFSKKFYATKVAVRRVVRGANPWSLENLARACNLPGGSSLRELLESMERINARIFGKESVRDNGELQLVFQPNLTSLIETEHLRLQQIAGRSIARSMENLNPSGYQGQEADRPEDHVSIFEECLHYHNIDSIMEYFEFLGEGPLDWSRSNIEMARALLHQGMSGREWRSEEPHV